MGARSAGFEVGLRRGGLIALATLLVAACQAPPPGPISREALLARLGTFAAVTAARSALVDPASGVAASRLLAQGGANLVSNGGGRLVSNGGGRLVSNGGASLQGQGGKPYALAGLPAAGVSLTPAAGEYLTERLYPDGTRFLVFKAPEAVRTALLSPGGEVEITVDNLILSRHPGGAYERVRARRRAFAGETQVLEATTVETRAADGSLRALDVEAASATAPQTGWRVEVAEMRVDFEARTARYTVRFPNLGLVETSAEGGVRTVDGTPDSPALDEPLRRLRGEALLKTLDGQTVIRKRRDASGLWYDLGDDTEVYVQEPDQHPMEGLLLHRRLIRGTVTFAAARARPGTLGMGVKLGEARLEAVVRDGKVVFEPAPADSSPAPASVAPEVARRRASVLDPQLWLVMTALRASPARYTSFAAGPGGLFFLLDEARPLVLVLTGQGDLVAAFGKLPEGYPRHQGAPTSWTSATRPPWVTTRCGGAC